MQSHDSAQCKLFNPEHRHRLDSEDRRKLIPPKTVLDAVNIREGETFVDIGAGTGFFALPALEYVKEKGRVIAVDISEVMLDEIRKKSGNSNKNLETVLCSPDKIPLPDKVADKVLLAFVFHEVENQDKYLFDVGRLLKDDGEIIIVEWDKKNTRMGPPLHERLSCDDLIVIANKQGFSVSGFMEINDVHYMCILKKR